MRPFLLSTGSGEYDLRLPVGLVRQGGSCKEALDVDDLCTYDKRKAFFQRMGKHVVASESPVGDKDGMFAIRVAVNQLTEGGNKGITAHASLCGKVGMKLSE